MSSNQSLFVILCFLWLAIAFQFALAVHGWLVERREGMRFSKFRLFTVSGLFVAATVLTLIMAFLPEPQPPAPAQAPVASAEPSTAPPSDDPRFEAIRSQIKEEEGEIAKLDEQKSVRQKKVQELQKSLPQTPSPSASPALTQSTPISNPISTPISRQTLLLEAVAATALFLLVGFVVLMAGGELQTLFPEGLLRSRKQSVEHGDSDEALEDMTAAVWRKDYTRALAIAERIREKRLAQFNRLDFLFLRAYCSIQVTVGEDAEKNTENVIQFREDAVRDLESLVEEAPRRGEAAYLLGLAYGLTGRYAEGLAMFEQSQGLLKQPELPFLHNESVCLLRLGEVSLTENKLEQAESYFGRVTNLGKIAGAVVESRLTIGMNEVRDAINKKDMGAAAAALQKLEGLKELKPEHKVQIEVIHVAFNARIALLNGDDAQAQEQSAKFLAKHLPPDLPEPDEEVADETFGSLILDKDLPFPREVFRGFLFIQAVALCKLETRGRSMLSEAQVARLSAPLLRGLQFDPRQRDLLGALGALYYWFRKDKRQKALDWLEAAALMGVSGRIVRNILERDRLIEMERREALDWFRSASARFLRDPSLAADVRRALVEELGRFQEFEPLLMSLEDKPDLEAEEPTLEVIKERGRYLAQLVAHVSARGQVDRHKRLTQISEDYARCLQTLESTTDNITTLERRVFEELGDALSLEAK